MADSRQETGTGAIEPTGAAMYEATRKRRHGRRRAKEHKDDITDLNITPMLDMMTILLVFLIKSYSTSTENVSVANLVLPHSTTTLRVEEALQLMITTDGILVDQKPVTALNKGQLRPEDLPEGANGFLIKPLYDALETRSAYFKKIQEFGGTQFVGRIAVVADKKIPYGILFRVLYTCGRAEFGRFKLFVRNSG